MINLKTDCLLTFRSKAKTLDDNLRASDLLESFMYDFSKLSRNTRHKPLTMVSETRYKVSACCQRTLEVRPKSTTFKCCLTRL